MRYFESLKESCAVISHGSRNECHFCWRDKSREEHPGECGLRKTSKVFIKKRLQWFSNQLKSASDVSHRPTLYRFLTFLLSQPVREVLKQANVSGSCCLLLPQQFHIQSISNWSLSCCSRASIKITITVHHKISDEHRYLYSYYTYPGK